MINPFRKKCLTDVIFCHGTDIFEVFTFALNLIFIFMTVCNFRIFCVCHALADESPSESFMTFSVVVESRQTDESPRDRQVRSDRHSMLEPHQPPVFSFPHILIYSPFRKKYYQRRTHALSRDNRRIPGCNDLFDFPSGSAPPHKEIHETICDAAVPTIRSHEGRILMGKEII